MANTYRKIQEDNDTIVLPTPASTAIEIGDLCYWDDSANVAKPASSQTDQGSEAANQREFADKFVGVALQQRLSSETTTGDSSRRTFCTDGVFEFVCPSTTWEIGDLVGASEDSGDDGLEDQQVERVTSKNLAIGVCVERTTAAKTTVKVRLLSKWASDLAHHRDAASDALVISNGDGATDLTPNEQIVGTSKANASLLLASFNTTDNNTVCPSINLLKSGNATAGLNTVVASGEVLGELNFFGADGTDFESPAGALRCEVDNTPGTGDMPGRLVFLTTADGGETLTEALRITSTQDVRVNDGGGLIVGSTSAQLTISDGDGTTNLIPEVQVLGTTKADASLLIAGFNTTDDATVAPALNFLKSGHGTIGSNTVVASGEILGEITFFGADGTDFESPAARIQAVVDTTPGAGDMPGRLSFSVTADGGETLGEAMRIANTKLVTMFGSFAQGADATDRVTVKGIYMTPANVAVAVPSITDPDIARVQVDVSSAFSIQPAVGDAVIAIPQEALPTNARLQGAFVYQTDGVEICFGSEGGNVTGANKNFKFLIIDLT